MSDVRLVPVAAVEGQLQDAMRAHLLRDPGATFWLRMGASVSWVYKAPENGDWTKIARAVIGKDDTVLGYLAASLDRETNTVCQLTILRLTPEPTRGYSEGMRRFLRDLRAQFRSLRWSCIEGAPTEAIYQRLAERAGGHRVGVVPDVARTGDGKVRGEVWFWTPGLWTTP